MDVGLPSINFTRCARFCRTGNVNLGGLIVAFYTQTQKHCRRYHCKLEWKKGLNISNKINFEATRAIFN